MRWQLVKKRWSLVPGLGVPGRILLVMTNTNRNTSDMVAFRARRSAKGSRIGLHPHTHSATQLPCAPSSQLLTGPLI